ncbi:MAG: DsrE/DsrF/DrsH-like family protein [Bacillota bacterium]
MEQDPAAQTCRIIASKGTLDWAYPPLILASTAAALGMDTAVFCTFYGLELLRKDLNLKMDPIGNPAMPMPMPNLLAAMPGMRLAATAMMGSMFRKSGVASTKELREVCLASGVRFIACQMTVDVMGYKPEQFIDGIEFGGAAMFMAEAARAHTTLFI